MGYGGLNLPYDVPANEFLTLEGRGFSTSNNYAVWLTDYLERYDPDPLRYCLSAMMPETSDSDFSWSGYVRRNNDELVATLGNFVHRVMTLTSRNFDQQIPAHGELEDIDQQAITKCEETLREVGRQIERRRFRDALWAAMGLAQHGNRYIDTKAPWAQMKTNPEAAATTLWTALNLVATLRTVFYPFIPFSSERIHELLGFDGDVLSDGWRWRVVETGKPLPTPQPLFKKLDESVVELETKRLLTAKS
jgi:methionyl-tRNA synthetase